MDSHIRDVETVRVQIIRRKNGMSLIEWIEDGSMKRAWIPEDMIVAHESQQIARVENPGVGIPFGVDWARIISVHITPQDIDRELKRVGIWTADDLRYNPNAALGAIKSAIGLDLAALQHAAREYEKQLEV